MSRPKKFYGRIVELLESGENPEVIAEKIGVTPSYVYKIRRRISDTLRNSDGSIRGFRSNPNSQRRGGGIIYILRMGETDYYKIGHTTSDMETRISALQTGNPFPLIIREIFDGCSPYLEKELHRKLSFFTVTGGGSEWFLFPQKYMNEVMNRIFSLLGTPESRET